MPIVVNPGVLGVICQACTVTQITVTVDPSTVLQWCQLPGPVRHGPDPTPQSTITTPMTTPAAIHTILSATLNTPPLSIPIVGLLPMMQGVPSTNSLPLGPDFPMGPRHLNPFNTSYLYPCLPDSVWDSSGAAGFYENHAQNFPFNLPTTLGSTTTTFIPPSSMGMFNPHQARANFTTATATA